MKVLRGNLRRVVTGLFLAAAFLMLVFGMTLLSNQLKGRAFLIYWLFCFLLTGLAAILALLDMAAIRRESREKQRNLIKETLEPTENDSENFK